MTKPKPVVHFCFDDQLGPRILSGYSESSIKVDDESRSRTDGYRHYSTASIIGNIDAKYGKVSPYLHTLPVSRTERVRFFKRVRAVSVHYNMHVQG